VFNELAKTPQEGAIRVCFNRERERERERELTFPAVLYYSGWKFSRYKKNYSMVQTTGRPH
jgi:hypothetical protein